MPNSDVVVIGRYVGRKFVGWTVPTDRMNVSDNSTLIIGRMFNGDMEEVYRLVHDAFVEAGYIEPRAGGEFRHFEHLANSTVVLVAKLDGAIVGTNSWTLDGPAGVHTDTDFPEATAAVRAEGRKLGSSWRIATRHDCRNRSSVVKSLMRETCVQMIEAGIQTALFTFSDRHERIYQRLMNMTTLAKAESSHGLANVRPVLMRLDAENVPNNFRTREP